jgi:hypothetical protein
MKTSLNVMAAIAFVSGCFLMGFSQMSRAQNKDAAQAAKLLRHVVMFKFKDGTTADQVRTIENTFRGLPKKIDTIVDFEWGTDMSVEGKADGFTHCFFVTFRDEKGRETYLPHPAHKEFVSVVGPHVDKVLVFDYWSGK